MELSDDNERRDGEVWDELFLFLKEVRACTLALLMTRSTTLVSRPGAEPQARDQPQLDHRPGLSDVALLHH